VNANVRAHSGRNVNRYPRLVDRFRFGHCAERIAEGMNSPFRKAMKHAQRIARTEGHRISCAADYDGVVEAKKAGADVLRQWNAALDGRTRDDHRMLDGQLREVGEPFSIGGLKAMYPGGFGVAHEDINCRCTVEQRARWALDEEELERLKERAEYYGLDKAESFEEFKKKYLRSVDNKISKSESFDVSVDKKHKK